MAQSVSVLQRQEHSQEFFSHPWNPGISTQQLFQAMLSESFWDLPEATVAYLSEDKKRRAEEVTIEELKTKLGT